MTVSAPAPNFAHRALLGWISEFVRRTLPGEWPQIPLDDETLDDLDAYFRLGRDCGYNEIILWGLFVDRRWPLDIVSCVDEDRRRRILRVIEMAKGYGLPILSGLGLFSWGFDAIIEAHPRLSRTNRRVLCPSVPESREWMRRVVDFILGNFPLDGLNMQSADNGRCECDDCKGLSTVEYHARLNIEVADYVEPRWPRKMLIMDNWGCPFSDPSDLPHLVELSRRVTYINDVDDTAGSVGGDYRRRLIAALACPFGTLAGVSVWPPQRWEQDRWFLPTTVTNVPYIATLRADGSRSIEQFVTNIGNPSGEITVRFMGGLLSRPDADPERLLRDAVERTYQPANAAALDALVGIARGVESAYFGALGDETPRVGLFYIDGGLLPDDLSSPETYLKRLTPEGRAAVARAYSDALTDFERVAPDIGERDKADRTRRCLEAVLADLRKYEAT